MIRSTSSEMCNGLEFARWRIGAVDPLLFCDWFSSIGTPTCLVVGPLCSASLWECGVSALVPGCRVVGGVAARAGFLIGAAAEFICREDAKSFAVLRLAGLGAVPDWEEFAA